MMKKSVLSLALTLLLVSCDPVRYDTGEFPEVPVNFEEINTEFDDYNSTMTFLGEIFPLCFSSNRRTLGGNFDIIYKQILIRFMETTGELRVEEYVSSGISITPTEATLAGAVRQTVTTGDELGPCLLPMWEHYLVGYDSYVLVYSSDVGGNQDMYFTENITTGSYEEPRAITFLNSDSTDAYFTVNRDFTRAYFCSDREGGFDIYSAPLDNSQKPVEALSDDSPVAIEKVEILSSGSDDKCPCVIGDFMVFASDRPGGFGGFDLYYSEWENGAWSAPVNFGDSINTEFDEYRPIIRPEDSFRNDFMLFSSNRPGGLGGFDLYYVGVPKVKGLSSK